MKTVLVIIACCIGVCLASTAFSNPDPKNPGKCMYNGKELKKGENQFSDQCMQIDCNVDGSWSMMDCGVKMLDNCKRGDLVDVSLPYPSCCKWYFECENAEGKFTKIF